MAKRVRRPAEIKIGKKKYRVTSRSKAWGQKNKAYGQITYDKALIEIAGNHEDQPSHSKMFEMVDTVVHEIFHGVIKECNIKLDGRKEEKFVKNLATGYCKTLLDNPQLLEWLYQKIKDEQKN